MKVSARYSYHVPVLLSEVTRELRVSAGSWYVDATAGGGGHTREILKSGGRVLTIDQDEAAINTLRTRFYREIDSGRLITIKGNYVNIKVYVERMGIPIKGILFDLGMSTYQIKESGRGFSFSKNEPLDMRMSEDIPQTAAQIVNTFSESELYEIFRKFGEEHLARQLAQAIVRARSVKQLRMTSELTDLIHDVYQKASFKTSIHPATRTFQAIRIAVNEELAVLKSALPDAIDILDSGGRLLVVSYHSLEDRIVKLAFRKATRSGEVALVTPKPIVPTKDEIYKNPSARSAKLRIAQKV